MIWNPPPHLRPVGNIRKKICCHLCNYANVHCASTLHAPMFFLFCSWSFSWMTALINMTHLAVVPLRCYLERMFAKALQLLPFRLSVFSFCHSIKIINWAPVTETDHTKVFCIDLMNKTGSFYLEARRTVWWKWGSEYREIRRME